MPIRSQDILDNLHQDLQQRNRIIAPGNEDISGQELALRYSQHFLEKDYYTGGIFWITGESDELGNQIINFANSNLGLDIPENEDLQNKINHCWSNWRKGKVLLILDNIISYQQIKSYLPLNKQRFKILVTNQPQDIDESFKLFSLNSSVTEKNNDSLSESDSQVIDNFSKNLNWILLILLVISFSSLYGSYISEFSSTAWKEEYLYYGWSIELLRTFIVLILTGFLLGDNFSKESCEILGFQAPSGITIRFVKWTRFWIICLLAFVFIVVVKHHLDVGPEALAHSQSIDKSDLNLFFESCRLPYLLYLPYSLVNFVLIGVILVSFGVYSAVKDSIFLRQQYHIIRDRMKEISNHEKVHIIPLSKESCMSIETEFKKFSENYVDRLGRYSRVILSLSILVLYEHVFGKQTLSESALIWVGIGYFLVSAILFVIIGSYFFYEKALVETSKFINDSKCNEFRDFEKFDRENSWLRLFLKVLEKYVGFSASILLLIMAIILDFIFIK